jgi:hypothetical protein
MAGYGIPETDIARVLKLDPKTLRDHSRKEVNTGTTRAVLLIWRDALGPFRSIELQELPRLIAGEAVPT